MDDGLTPERPQPEVRVPNGICNDAWKFVATLAIGFTLTLLALPLVFFAACFPFMAGNTRDAAGVFITALGIADAAAVFTASVTKNAGVRWGAVALAILATGALTYLLIPSLR